MSTMPPSPRTNWSGNYRYHAAELLTPRNLPELQQMVAAATHAKVLGSRHSFQGIADTPGTQISLQHLREIQLDPANRQVTIEPGLTCGELAPWLHQRGFALHNLASLPHISVAGAVATATHGSGLRNGNLSTAVAAIELVTADGQLRRFSRNSNPDFPGAVVALGALGIVARLTLDLLPAFEVAQTVYENLPFAALEKHLEAIFSAAYSVSLFTDWQQPRATQVWLKRKVGALAMPTPAPEFYGATLATADLHPLPGHDPIHCTPQRNLPGPWHERLPHFRMDFTPSSGAELQTEYFVPLEAACRAIRAIEPLGPRIAPLLHVSELRTIAADDLWLSPCHGRPCLAIHFTWKPDWPAVQKLLPTIEAALAPFGALPHWGKLFTMQPEKIRAAYPRLKDFLELAHDCDPSGKFRNAFLDRNLFATKESAGN
ncbi:MAG: FAD-binding protein [Acidobacteriaceae bacterium]